MTEQKDLLETKEDKKYKRPKAKDNKHLHELLKVGYTIKQLSSEFCHDKTTVQKWVAGDQLPPMWTVTVANCLIAKRYGVISRYMVSPATKEQESIILGVMDGIGAPYKKFDF